jgi:predicted DNA-binding ribbon-helix-helix protein
MEGVITDVKRKDLEKKGKRAVGLDLLIKRTTKAGSEEKQEPIKPMTKRVTVVLDSSKIDTLKEIAKSQKRPLRKLMAELVEEFLDKGN